MVIAGDLSDLFPLDVPLPPPVLALLLVNEPSPDMLHFVSVGGQTYRSRFFQPSKLGKNGVMGKFLTNSRRTVHNDSTLHRELKQR